eukprot:TRINITY_DN39281_c0_g1_i1.p1 TRINITY_DN39281_c0_g1~~TRINITY_DN39281_c0_g1_i1.p1  ORF type:complete len:159 (-),score=47.55 TRINITY_DN39281_c0_g1_i1:64-540(-)
MQRGLVGSEMCIRDRYQRRVHGDIQNPISHKYTPYYSNIKDRASKKNGALLQSAKEILHAEKIEKPMELLPPRPIPSGKYPSLIALKYLEEQEKLNRLLKGSGANQKKLHLSMEANQRLVLGMVSCLLYTSDAADDTPCVDLGGLRIIKKKKSVTNFL